MTAKIVKGPKIPIAPIEKGLGEQFLATAEKYGNEICQIDANTEVTETWAQVRIRSVRLAIYMKSIGIKPCDVVMTGFSNNMDATIPVFASILIGACIVGFDSSHEISDIEYFLTYIEPKFVIVDPMGIEKLEKALEKVKLQQTPEVICGGHRTERQGNHLLQKNGRNCLAYMTEICSTAATFENEEDFKPFHSDENDKAFIFFSSGTSNLPKGICVSHRSMIRTCRYPLGAPLNTSSSDPPPYIQTVSHHWISASMILIFSIYNGAKRIVGDWTVERMFHHIQRHKINFLILTCLHVCDIIEQGEALAKQFDLSSLRLCVVIGSKFTRKQIETLQCLLGAAVYMGYGSTELSRGATSHRGVAPELIQKKLESVGRLLPNIELKIVDPESREILPPNKEGEILIKSPDSMLGYYKMENSDPFDEDGFLKTGDMGYYDEDDFIYVTDRLNSTFKYKLRKISPIIIENILEQHPSVLHATVFGIPNDRDKNHPAACVVLKQGHTATEQELREFADSRVIDDYKLRGGLKIVEQFPSTSSGKLQRRKVRELFLGLI